MVRPVIAVPSTGRSMSVKPGRSISGTRNERPSSPPVMSESCAARMAKAEATASVTMAKKMARTRSENRPIEEGQRDAGDERDGQARQRRGPGRAPAVERQPHAVAAEPVEHGVGEGDDAGVAEQQVVARHQHDEHAHLGRRVDGLRAPEQERRQRQHGQDRHQHHAQHPAARQIARAGQRLDHRACLPLGQRASTDSLPHAQRVSRRGSQADGDSRRLTDCSPSPLTLSPRGERDVSRAISGVHIDDFHHSPHRLATG